MRSPFLDRLLAYIGEVPQEAGVRGGLAYDTLHGRSSAPDRPCERDQLRDRSSVEFTSIDDSVDKPVPLDRSEQSAIIADPQAQPTRSTSERFHIDFGCALIQASQCVDNRGALTCVQLPQVALCPAGQPDGHLESSSSKTSSNGRPVSPLATSSSAVLIPATYSGAVARTKSSNSSSSTGISTAMGRPRRVTNAGRRSSSTARRTPAGFRWRSRTVTTDIRQWYDIEARQPARVRKTSTMPRQSRSARFAGREGVRSDLRGLCPRRLRRLPFGPPGGPGRAVRGLSGWTCLPALPASLRAIAFGAPRLSRCSAPGTPSREAERGRFSKRR